VSISRSVQLTGIESVLPDADAAEQQTKVDRPVSN